MGGTSLTHEEQAVQLAAIAGTYPGGGAGAAVVLEALDSVRRNAAYTYQ